MSASLSTISQDEPEQIGSGRTRQGHGEPQEEAVADQEDSQAGREGGPRRGIGVSLRRLRPVSG